MTEYFVRFSDVYDILQKQKKWYKEQAEFCDLTAMKFHREGNLEKFAVESSLAKSNYAMVVMIDDLYNKVSQLPAVPMAKDPEPMVQIVTGSGK